MKCFQHCILTVDRTQFTELVKVTDIQENTTDIDENFLEETRDPFSRRDSIQRTPPGVNSVLESYTNTLCETPSAPRASNNDQDEPNKRKRSEKKSKNRNRLG